MVAAIDKTGVKMLKFTKRKRSVFAVERIAKFETVSKAQYIKDVGEEMAESYIAVRLPRRATAHSAGYDFFTPCDVFLPPHGSAIVKTGVRALMREGWVLLIYPRSGLGFRFGIHLANTVGVIDGDYANAPNEGHIMIKLTNPTEQSLTLGAGTAIAQGIFTPYGITVDDNVTAEREGGFGSTDGK